MTDHEFDEIIRKRLNWVNSSRDNGFDFNDILAGAYHDPSHFIFEVLQNADDENATQVKFELGEDGIDIYHDGRDFDLKDVEGVTGIGSSKKKEDLTSIGKFGVGFKSVFAITKTPYIFSGAYNFKITDFVVPEKIDKPFFNYGTLIKLPFNHSQRSKQELYDTVSDKLKSLGLKTLLFLKNIKSIYWKSVDSELELSKSIEKTKVGNAEIVVLSSSATTEKYLVFKKDFFLVENKLRAEVAFKLGQNESGSTSIVKDTDTRLVVFMPTETQTYLNFIIQGPFRTTPNRENVPLDDTNNDLILEKIGDLVSESLLSIKEMGYFDSDFMKILPITTEQISNSKIYSVVFKRTRDRLLNETILPTADGKFGRADEVLLSRGKELSEFLNQQDIGLLFGKKKWLDTSITYDRTRNLRDYIIGELKIQEVDFENFARRINLEFLKTKSDNWMIGFYSKLLEQESLWAKSTLQKGVLRSRPIIRLENDDHIAPFDENGRNLAYLPTEGKSEYKTVKRSIAVDENASKFLVALGLTEPDQLAEIRTFIMPRYEDDSALTDSNYLNDFEKLLTGYENIRQTDKYQYISELKVLNFIQCKSNKSQILEFCKPNEAYYPSNELVNYFSLTDGIYFVSEQLTQHFTEERLLKFLKELGVSDGPRRIKIRGNISNQERVMCEAKVITYVDHDWDYELEGLDNLLKSINTENSMLLWRVISKKINNMGSSQAKDFFNGEFSWFRYNSFTCKYTATFTKKLRSSQWIVNKDNSLVKPTEITFTEISENYEMDFDNMEILREVLEFKPEILNNLPPEMRKRLDMVSDIPIDSLERLVTQFKSNTIEETEEEWIPKVGADKPPLHILNVDPNKNEPISISIFEKSDHEDKNSDEPPQRQKTMLDTKKRKKIGNWGEEFVFNALKKDYGINSGYTIVWSNENGDTGKGYDIIIKREGYEPEFVEVKSKTQDTDELIEVTGTQWETARTLFEQGSGDRYSICVVHNPGTMDARIERLVNPFNLWREGKLFAHPINLRL
jgi:hypothetical protein